MSGRGDSSAGGDRITSPVQDGGNRRSGRNDGYEFPNNAFQRRRQECIDSYTRFVNKLNNITVNERNPYGYTQKEHDWLKGCIGDMHQLDIRIIDIQQRALNCSDLLERRQLNDQEWRISNERCPMVEEARYITIRDKFDKYDEWGKNPRSS